MNICKRLCAAFLLSVVCVGQVLAQGYPRISTKGNEHWYYVKYLRSNNVLEDKGEKQKCLTAVPQVMSSDKQLWKVVADEGFATNKKYISFLRLLGMFVYLFYWLFCTNLLVKNISRDGCLGCFL